MTKDLVTVVLPIYNVEKYLNQCIESVTKQTYTSLEIILVDDGSTDSCPKICDEWAAKDERIRVIHKQNAGLGMARNTGIENATGEYICFFDSDDFIAADTIEKIYGLARKETADIVVFGISTVDDSLNINEVFVPKAHRPVYTGSQVHDEFFAEYIAPDPNGDGLRRFYMSSCLMLYSMSLINKAGWRFVSERDIISEDVYSLLGLFNHVEKVAVLPESLYFYRKNYSSLSRVYRKDRYEKIKHFYCSAVELSQKLGYGENIIHRVSKPYLAFTIAALKQECAHHGSWKVAKKTITEIIGDDVLQTVLEKNKNDNVSRTRKVLFYFMRRKMFFVCYLILKAGK